MDTFVDADHALIFTTQLFECKTLIEPAFRIKAKQYFGKDIVGRKCYEAFHQRQNPCEPYPCLTLKAFQDGKMHRHETTVIDAHSQTHFFECTANVALKDESGKPVAVLEISRDITERTQAEAALKKSEKRFRDLAKMLPVEKLVPADVAVAAPGLQPTAGIAASESAAQSPRNYESP